MPSHLNPKHLFNPLIFPGATRQAVRLQANDDRVLAAQILSASGAKGG
jgi:hypothetical protein